MKTLAIITRLFFVIAIAGLAFSASIALAVNNTQFYTARFEKYNVRQSLAQNGLVLDGSQMQGIAESFIHYFNSSEEYINLTVTQNGNLIQVFNEEEKIHFKDVKGLFVLDYKVLAVSMVYCLGYGLVAGFWRRGKYRLELAWNTIYGSGFTLGLMLLVGVGFLIDFNGLWMLFHQISFSNTFWSASGNMLLLFPDGFWIDAVRFCVILAAGIAAVLGVTGWVYTRFQKRKTG